LRNSGENNTRAVYIKIGHNLKYFLYTFALRLSGALVFILVCRSGWITIPI